MSSDPIPSEVFALLRAGQRLRALHTWSQRQPMSMAAASAALDALLTADLDLREAYLAAIGLGTLLRLEIDDGLQLPGGGMARQALVCVFWLRCPQDWVDSRGTVSRDLLDAICELLYGAGWRHGNSDGSRYVVLAARAEVLPASRGRAWLDAVDGVGERHWFVHAMADGGVAKVPRERF